ncbi:MAG: hypothetical protein ACD_20C00435G0002 [uncultured bacterium]|nr:MAG: hypothetical protein ACD_20C00435G0002 [uncultured bacterium]
MVFSALINWIKELFFKKDNSLIGLTRLQDTNVLIKEVSKEKVGKSSKDIKISDLIKGESH